MSKENYRGFRDLIVYQKSYKAALEIFEITKSFPADERYSLTDQIRRSSRSVCSNTSEAFRKRRYPKSFTAKLNDAEGEAAETQTWLEFSLNCQYIDQKCFDELYVKYDNIIGKLVNMENHPEHWTV